MKSSNLIGLKTISIPGIFLGVCNFRGRTVNGKGEAGIEHGKKENEKWEQTRELEMKLLT